MATRGKRRHAAPRSRLALLHLLAGALPHRPAVVARRGVAAVACGAGLAALATAGFAGGVGAFSQPLTAALPVGTGAGGSGAAHPTPLRLDLTAPLLTEPTSAAAVRDDGLTSDERVLSEVALAAAADISPKSIVGNGAGLFFAQNMVYQHSVTVYASHAVGGRGGGVHEGEVALVTTIGDAVDLADFGFADTPRVVQGAPVEAVATEDGRFVYVSNYEMSGPGYVNPGHDNCGPGGWDDSFVYRIDTRRLAIDRIYQVGSVPKFLALTPGEETLLVANWCDYDLSIVDLATGIEARRVALGPYPRGIAVDPSGRVAYVAVMGTTSIAVVDLSSFAVTWWEGVGSAPRHLVLSPDGRHLFVTLNTFGEVAKLDARTGEVLARTTTGSAPRSMAIADDGRSLYVVNYLSNTVAKVRAADLEVLQVVPSPDQPIGITYDAASRTVWVAGYSGTIQVLQDTAPD